MVGKRAPEHVAPSRDGWQVGELLVDLVEGTAEAGDRRRRGVAVGDVPGSDKFLDRAICHQQGGANPRHAGIAVGADDEFTDRPADPADLHHGEYGQGDEKTQDQRVAAEDARTDPDVGQQMKEVHGFHEAE